MIEIRSRFARKNYECSIQDFCSKWLNNCNYMSFNAMPESVEMGSQDNWGIPEAYKLRDIVTLAYLGQSSLMSKTPFSISFQDINTQLLQFSKKTSSPGTY